MERLSTNIVTEATRWRWWDITGGMYLSVGIICPPVSWCTRCTWREAHSADCAWSRGPPASAASSPRS